MIQDTIVRCAECGHTSNAHALNFGNTRKHCLEAGCGCKLFRRDEGDPDEPRRRHEIRTVLLASSVVRVLAYKTKSGPKGWWDLLLLPANGVDDSPQIYVCSCRPSEDEAYTALQLYWGERFPEDARTRRRVQLRLTPPLLLTEN